MIDFQTCKISFTPYFNSKSNEYGFTCGPVDPDTGELDYYHEQFDDEMIELFNDMEDQVEVAVTEYDSAVLDNKQANAILQKVKERLIQVLDDRLIVNPMVVNAA